MNEIIVIYKDGTTKSFPNEWVKEIKWWELLMFWKKYE